MRRDRKRCFDGSPCAKECPIPSVDNFGQPYPGCARFRLKTLAEIDAMTESPKPVRPKVT